MAEQTNEWKPGLPKGPPRPDLYEVYFSPGGMKWHRRKPQPGPADSDPKEG